MILLYHKVYMESPTMWWVDVDNFYRQMCEIKCRKVVYLDEYDPNDKDHVVITFDGVYKNVLHFATPILKDFGYPFELFITSDYLGKDNSFDQSEPRADFASIENLKELITCGGRLQWHAKTHRNLKEVVDEAVIASELAVPDDLRRLDDKGFRWFAYPHGDFNAPVVEETKKRFKGAVSCIQGNDKGPFQLNRMTVTNETTFKKGSLTVIIASYNYGSYLIEAIESVLRQTRPADEILIADDCSTDNTKEIALEYQRRYPLLIRYFRNEQNLGIVKNFNKAVSMVKSDYICFLGADNRFRSDYLEKTSEILDSDENIAIAYTDFALFGPRARLIYNDYPYEWKGPVKEKSFYIINFPEFNEETKKILEEINFMHGSSLYRRGVFFDVDGYKEKAHMPEDYDLFLRMIRKGWLAKRVPCPVLEYRQHSRAQANISLGSYAELNFYKNLYKDFYKEYKEHLAAKERQLIEKERQLSAILNSWSWRITAPLRIFGRLLQGLKRDGLGK